MLWSHGVKDKDLLSGSGGGGAEGVILLPLRVDLILYTGLVR